MSAGSASPRTEPRAAVDRLALERLVGVRSSKSSFYAAWRDKSDRLDHTIETLERISSALCTAPAGPIAVCDAVVEAAAYHFDARWAAMVFPDEDPGGRMPRVIVHASHAVVQRWDVPPVTLAALADRTLTAQRPVLVAKEEGIELGGEPCAAAAAPMPVHGKLAGMLVVGLGDDVEVAPSDVSILVTLANHAGVALHNASLFQENERRSSELERRGSELEGTLRRLEQAGRRQLLSEERNRIARELHDSVAQRPGQLDLPVARQFEDHLADLAHRGARQLLGGQHALDHDRRSHRVAPAPLEIHADRQQLLRDAVVELPRNPVALLAQKLPPAGLLEATQGSLELRATALEL